MSHYRNGCTCERCRTRGMMGPAILVTLGVLLLLDQLNYVGFWSSAPVLLIVIGLVKVLQGNASMQGHVQQPYPYVGYAAYPVAPAPPAVPPTAPPSTSNQGQVPNG